MRKLTLALVAALLLPGVARTAQPDLPYRFLLVIGDQWKDDSSVSIQQSNDFQILAALLKTWGLPFDVLRLDQQRMDRYHMLDRDGSPLYGTVLWDTGLVKPGDEDLSTLEEMVSLGTSVVVVGDAIGIPRMAALAGVRHVSRYQSEHQLTISHDHLIVRGLQGREAELMSGVEYYLPGDKVVPDRAVVLASRGPHPFLTVREDGSRGRVAWLGAERTPGQPTKQLVRDLLKRSLVWAQGYALYADYGRSVVLFLDDMGASDKTMLSYWHYKTLTEDEIRRGLIEPLKRHGAVLDLNIVTGYVDRKTRRVLNPWVQKVIDAIDDKTMHDYASNKRGIDAGVKDGVFEVQSHGWTHMLPDLDSRPGPWWDAPMDGVGSLDWYNEFADRLRSREIPAATQREHLRRSIQHLREDFGAVPLVVRPGGSAYSRSPANNTAVIAASMGLGLATWDSAVYLSPALVVSLESVSTRTSWGFDRKLTASQIPWSVDAPHLIGFHDRDIAMDEGCLNRLLMELGEGVRYISGAEYAGYMHALVERQRGSRLTLKVDYDPHYCRAFSSKESVWTLHISDETRRDLGGQVPEKRLIRLPSRTGTHLINVAAAR